MEIMYRGSKEHGLRRIEPRKFLRGEYVYATPKKVLDTLIMMKMVLGN